MDGGARVVAYDPRFCWAEYDLATGTELEKWTMVAPFTDEWTIGPDGVPRGARGVHTYARVVDRETVTVYEDGRMTSQEPHGLGVVPVVHLPYQPYVDPAHGMWAAPGLDAPLAQIDSLMTMLGAVMNRHASPILVARGFKIGSGSPFEHGRVINGIPAGGDAAYLEASLSGLDAAVAAAQQQRESVRQTLPEFLFTEAGAASSGAALSLRASQFVAKMSEIRSRWLDGIATVTEYARAMDAGRAYDPTPTIAVTGGPILPTDAGPEIAQVQGLYDAGLLTLDDTVEHLQRLGMVPADVDPVEYAERLRARSRDTAEAEAVAVERIARAATVPRAE
jgi:hypothetical protein